MTSIQRKIKNPKKIFHNTHRSQGGKNIKNSRPDFTTFWVNGFPQTYYLYISIPDSKVNETCITLACS